MNLHFSYRNGDLPVPGSAEVLEVDFRHFSTGEFLRLEIESGVVRIVDDASYNEFVGVTTEESATADVSKWYDVSIITDEERVEIWRGLLGQAKELILTINNAPYADQLEPDKMIFGFSDLSVYHLDNIRYHSPPNFRHFLKLKLSSPAVDTGITDPEGEGTVQNPFFFHDFDDKVGPIDSVVIDPNDPDEDIFSDMGANEYPFLEGTGLWWELF